MPQRVIFGLALLLCLCAGAGSAQAGGAIGGAVRDGGSGEPVAGARVTVPSAGIGTLSDEAGRFLLTAVPPGPVEVRVEMLGYRSLDRVLDVPAGGTVAVELVLRPAALSLDAILVTGTGYRARRREVAHGVGAIEAPDVAEPVRSVSQLLASRLPGVAVLPGSGMAGSGSQIRLRGNVSVSLGNEPLVYVDGVRIRSQGYPKNVPRVGYQGRGPNEAASPLNDLNPADIDRIEVVRGPAATTLYGAEAASGVIEIFTKRGRTTDPVWTFSMDQGLDRVPRFGTAADPYMGLGPWLNDGWRQRYAASVARGGPVAYYLSGALDHGAGLLPNDGATRMVGRANVDVRPVEDLTLRWSASHAVHAIQITAAAINSHGLPINAFLGESNFLGDADQAKLDRLLEYDIDTDIDHTTLGLRASYAPSSAMTHRVTLGYDRAAAELRQLRPAGFILAPDGILAEEDWVDRTTTVEYVGSLALGRAALRSTLSWGAQSVTSDVESVAGYAEGFRPGAAPTLETGALSLSFRDRLRVRNSGAFAQLLLALHQRYFLLAGLRVDGSTAFGNDLEPQLYPRIGASYVVSDEPFWPEGTGTLKLRASYGHAGRAPGVIDALRTWREVDYLGRRGYLPAALGNPELAPERTAELEAGFEASFLGDRVRASFSAYDQRTTEALLPVAPIPSLGFLESQLRNVGTLRNHGVELSLDATILTGSVDWEAGLQLSTNRSEAGDLGAADSLQLAQSGWILEGQPVPVVRGARVLNPGEIGDPVVDYDHVHGPNLPTRTLGLRSMLRFPADVELHARVEYQGGHFLYDNIGNYLARHGRYPPCAEAYPAIEAGNTAPLSAWQRFWCDPRRVPPDEGPIYPADFLRFRELTLRAPVPGSLLGGAATVSLSARNFWTWRHEDFLLFDPEMAGADGMHARVRMIDAHLPVPASFVLSLRWVR